MTFKYQPYSNETINLTAQNMYRVVQIAEVYEFQ